MLGQVLAATISASPGTPVTGGVELTVLLVLGATLLLIGGTKLLFQGI